MSYLFQLLVVFITIQISFKILKTEALKRLELFDFKDCTIKLKRECSETIYTDIIEEILVSNNEF